MARAKELAQSAQPLREKRIFDANDRAPLISLQFLVCPSYLHKQMRVIQ
jgi:hypothetical protein